MSFERILYNYSLYYTLYINMFEARQKRGKLSILISMKTFTLQSCKAIQLHFYHLQKH
jgi:hypothetical protein